LKAPEHNSSGLKRIKNDQIEEEINFNEEVGLDSADGLIDFDEECNI